jgi:pantoate--beta-alanine ligase
VRVITTPAEMRVHSDRVRAHGARLALVPTMGALHDGHLALVRRATELADHVVVSIFVNPLQFDVTADFQHYPRPIDADLAACAAAGVDAVYAPTAASMYPNGFDTAVLPGGLAEGFEGAHRPGHFQGVTTVVTKLFTAVRPDAAVFGQKDAQQLAIVRRMTADLDLGVAIDALPTVREPDGLAMSSRNRRLSPADRAAAPCLHEGLLAGVERARAGGDVAEVEAAARAPIEHCELARVEYLALVDPATFTASTTVDDQQLLVVAAWFGDVRLIDNMPL